MLKPKICQLRSPFATVFNVGEPARQYQSQLFLGCGMTDLKFETKIENGANRPTDRIPYMVQIVDFHSHWSECTALNLGYLYPI